MAELKEPYEQYDPKKSYPRHYAAHPNGGFHMSYVNDTKNTEIVKSIVKQVGSKILKGEIQNIMTLSKPAALCKDITYAEIIAFDLMNLDRLKQAATVNTDPIFQMKCVITHTLSSMHISPEQLFMKAPIDNLLGETSHLCKNDGTQYYSESISSNPPQALFQILGPNKCYEIYGSHQVRASATPTLNALNGSAYGTKTIEFAKGNKFQIEYSQLQIGGLIMGDRTLNMQKTFRITNVQNNLTADIKFHFDGQSNVQKAASSIGSFFGVGTKKQTSKRKQDDFDVVIYKQQKIDGDEFQAIVSTGNGNWLEFIQFDGVIFWKVEEKQEPWQAATDLLPSDCTFRLDRELIKKGQTELAEKQKNMYEERDRREKEIRNKNKKQKGEK